MKTSNGIWKLCIVLVCEQIYLTGKNPFAIMDSIHWECTVCPKCFQPFYVLSHSLLTIALGVSYSYSHLTDGETEVYTSYIMQGWHLSSAEGQVINVSALWATPFFPNDSTLLVYRKTAVNNMYMNECGCLPINLYFPNRLGFGCGHSSMRSHSWRVVGERHGSDGTAVLLHSLTLATVPYFLSVTS